MTCLFASIGLAMAQGKTIEGIVVSEAGEPLPGAYIIVEGANVGTMTDDQGEFLMVNIPDEATKVIVSLLGMATTEVAITSGPMKIVMVPDATSLDETIVVAYGAVKKSSFTGSATQLSGEKLEKIQATNVSKGLEGAIAGVQITSSSGTPGSSASIYVRGIGSISASKSPLIIVDGTPYEGSLNSIPAQDIESLTVLKDAAANSMYGARGSNGVIMISTKRGNAGKVQINFEAKAGVNSRAVPNYDVITNPGEYYETMWEAARNNAYYTLGMPMSQAATYASSALTGELGLYNIYKGIDNSKIIDPATGKLNPNATNLKWTDNWDDVVFRPGIRQEYNMSAAGGSERTQGYLSLSYLNDEGYVANSGFSRIAVRGKVDHKVNNWLKAGVNISYANTNQKVYNDNESNNYSNLFFSILATPPIYPVYAYDMTTGEPLYDKDGNRLYDWGTNGRPFGANGNAYGQLMTSDYNTVKDNISSRGYVTVNILKDLVASANVAFDVFNTKDNKYTTPVGGDAQNVGGRGYQTMSRYMALNTNQTLNWTPTFGRHSLNVLLGHEIKSDQSYELQGHMTNFVDPNVSDFDNAVVYQGLNSNTAEYFLQGYFGRAEWNYDERYYGSASYRRDGSSRFAPDKRWGSFWSVSGAWNISNEAWMQNVSQINFLKVKASFGTQGNDNVGYTKVYQDLYAISRVDGEASLTKVFRAAPDVTWEKSNNFNLGLEGKFFNRLTLNVEYFVKETTDMIYARPLAPSQGSPSSQLVNDIDMMNRGVEFDANVTVVSNRNVNWDININGTHYKNKITKLPSDYPVWGKQVGTTFREVGLPLYNFYLHEWAGVNPENGEPMFNKYETDPETGLSTGKLIGTVNNTNDATYVKTGKTPIPALYGGFGTSLTAFGFDLNAQFAYQIGGYTLDSGYQSLMSPGDNQTNWHKDIFNRWTPENTETDVPRLQFGAQQANLTSTRFLVSSSYISLRYLSLGYTFPAKWTNAIKVKSLRVFLQGENLWYLSARKGLDVRKSISGGTDNTYSALRTVSAGVSLSF